MGRCLCVYVGRGVWGALGRDSISLKGDLFKHLSSAF